MTAQRGQAAVCRWGFTYRPAHIAGCSPMAPGQDTNGVQHRTMRGPTAQHSPPYPPPRAHLCSASLTHLRKLINTASIWQPTACAHAASSTDHTAASTAAYFNGAQGQPDVAGILAPAHLRRRDPAGQPGATPHPHGVRSGTHALPPSLPDSTNCTLSRRGSDQMYLRA